MSDNIINALTSLYASSAQNPVNTTTTPAGTAALSNLDFTKILLAEMASPNLDSLFSTDENGTSSSSSSDFFNSSLLGNSNSPLAAQLLGGGTGLSGVGSGSITQSLTPQMQLSIWSNYIGKNIEAKDASGKAISGKVTNVVMDNGSPMLVVNGINVDPNTVTKVS